MAVDSQADRSLEVWNRALVDLAADGDSGKQTRAWLRHFVGREADRQWATAGRTDAVARPASFLLWELARHAVATHSERPWLQHQAFDELISSARKFLFPGGRDASEAVYAQSAMDLLEGHCRAVSAVADLTRAGPDAALRFASDLSQCVRHYAAFWQKADPFDKSWSDPKAPCDACLAEVGSPVWAQWSLAALRRALDELCEGAHPGFDAALRIGMAMAEHAVRWMLGQLPQVRDDDHRRATILFSVDERQSGVAAWLHIDRRKASDGAGTTVLYPDPVWLGICVPDETFLTSFARAAECVARGAELGRIAWRLEFPGLDDHQPADRTGLRADRITGGSASGAAACALVALRDGLPLDAGTCVMAEVTQDLTLSPVTGRVAKLLGLQEQPTEPDDKRQADFNALVSPASPYVSRLLVCQPTPWLEQAAHRHTPRIEIEPVEDLDGVLDWMSGRLEAVLWFLDALAEKALAEHLLFKPPGYMPSNYFEFCIEPQVITEQEWRELEKKRKDHRQRVAELLDEYVTGISEQELREEGDLRLRPRSLKAFLNNRVGLIALRGEPGEGKTTALFWALARHCRQLGNDLVQGKYGLDDPRCRIPLALPLGNVDGAAEDSLLEQSCKYVLDVAFRGGDDSESWVRTVSHWLQAKCRRREVRLFLDALDELVTNDALDHSAGSPSVSRRRWLENEVATLRGQVPMLLSARYTANLANLSIPQNAELRIVCFGPREQRRYVERYFAKIADGSEKAQHLLIALHQTPGPKTLARLPLLLAILCRVMETLRGDQRLPRTKTEVLKAGLYGMLRHWHRKQAGGQELPWHELDARGALKERVLRHVAWRFYATRPLVWARAQFRDAVEQLPETLRTRIQDGADLMRADHLLNELLGDGIVARKADGYGFVLRSFHEYCLAGWIACESPAVQRDDFADFERMIRGRAKDWGRLDDPAWRHPVEALADGASPEGIKPLNQPGWQHVWPLVAGQLNTKQSDWLLSAVRAESEDVLCSRSRLAAAAAGELICRDAVEPILLELCQRLRSRLWTQRKADGWGNRHFACALGAMQYEPATDVLRSMSGAIDENDFLQADAHAGLALVMDSCMAADTTCQEAVVCLEDENADLGRRCESAAYLGKIESEDSLNALIRYLANRDGPESLRSACASALTNHSGSRARDALFSTLGDRLPRVRRACASALANSCDEDVCDALIVGVQNVKAESIYRQECAYAVGEMGTRCAADALIHCLKSAHEELLLRILCAEALSKIGGPDAREVLLSIAHLNLRGDWRLSPLIAQCIEGLARIANISDDTEGNLLSDAIENKGLLPHVRLQCAHALVRRGDTKGIAWLIKRLMEHDVDEFTLAKCASALGSSDHPLAEKALVTLLELGQPYHTRSECTMALARWSDSLSRQTLLSLLKRRVDFAWDALERVRAATGWRPLDDGSCDSP